MPIFNSLPEKCCGVRPDMSTKPAFPMHDIVLISETIVLQFSSSEKVRITTQAANLKRPDRSSGLAPTSAPLRANPCPCAGDNPRLGHDRSFPPQNTST